MSVESILAAFRKEFPNEHGTFDLLPGESINVAVREHNVPRMKGVYVIFAGKEIVYIGKAGTLLRDGSFRNQTLRVRLTRKQDKVSRKIFFETKMEEMNLPALRFEWFVTFDGARTLVPPFLAEAELLAAFYSDFRRLPSWNKSA